MEKKNTDKEHTDAINSSITKDEEEEDVPLPGFRFHPTDEELVGFYLRRKVDKKPLSIELIKQVDIYKFDPRDLPKTSSVGDNEGYFFCRRGRKYRNSIRPNRVTGSGFWKATGIDKPIYSVGGECIGLKKTLVYYRGSAGKATKTEWMMHEFRLPTVENTPTTHNNDNCVNTTKSSAQEAEVWTICRIFKRNVSYKKYTPDWRQQSNKRQSIDTSSINTCSTDSNSRETYVCFSAPAVLQQCYQKPVVDNPVDRKQFHVDQWELMSFHPSSSMASSSNVPTSPYGNDFFTSGDWDELRSVVDFAFNPPNAL